MRRPTTGPPRPSDRALCWVLLLGIASTLTGASARVEARRSWPSAGAGRVELQRWADRMGIAVLIGALDGRDSRRRAVALAAVRWADRAWRALPSLVRLMRSRDVALARGAAQTARWVAERVDRATLQRNEALSEALRPLAMSLLALAKERRRSADVRARAILVVAQLRDVVDLSDAALEPWLADPDATVRRAAVELFAAASSGSSRARLLERVASDGELAVARAAAAAVCAQLPPQRRSRGRGREQATIDALRPLSARLRQLAEEPGASVDQVADIARCLGRLDKESRAAARRLQRRSPAVARALRHIR